MVKALPNSSIARADVPSQVRSCAPAEPEDATRNSSSCAPVKDPRQAGRKIALRLPKSSKLLRHADFQRVYKQGRRHFAAHMTVFYLMRDDGAGPRVGLTVGRVLGGAVVRNRIKRRLREAVRHGLASLALPVDVVINPRKSALAGEFALLKDEVARAFEKIQSTKGSG